MTFLLVGSFPDSLLNFRGPLLDALLDCALDVHVAAPDLPADSLIRKRLEAKGLKVHEIPLQRTGLNPLFDFYTFVHLCKLMYRIRPDCVLTYTVKPVIYGSLAAMFVRCRCRFALITGLGYAFQGQGGCRALLHLFVQRLYSFALSGTQKIFFQNPDDEALFRSLGIVKPSTISRVVNGSGVDVSLFDVSSLPSTPVRFLLIARLLGEKGVCEYAEAARQMRRQYPDVQFDLVGWIDENPDSISQQELDGWIAEGIINYHGKLNDVRPVINKCSVYVLPSYREGTPRTVLEAMAMGRPVITTDAPGCRETVIDGDNGFLVPVKSVDDLVKAMEKFINQPELIEKMGKRSRIIAEEKYDVHKVNAFMLKEMGIQ